jgi:hypothetical protein
MPKCEIKHVTAEKIEQVKADFEYEGCTNINVDPEPGTTLSTITANCPDPAKLGARPLPR